MRILDFLIIGLAGVALAIPARAQQPDTVRITIAEAVARALQQGDEVRIARAQEDVADAQVTTARATGLPQFRFSSSYTQILENARARSVNSVFGQPFNYVANVNVSQTLFQGGRVLAGARAATAFRAAAVRSREETEALAAVNTQRAYLEAILARQLLQIQERNVALSEARLRQVEQLEKGGRMARFDVLRARVERTNLEPVLLQARSNRELADIALRRLLNLPANAPLALTTELDTARLHDAVQLAARDSVVPRARAAIRAAQATLDARREGVRVAFADFLPAVSTFFQTGYSAFPATNGVPTFWGRSSNAFCAPTAPVTQSCQNNGWFPDRQFGVQISWNLFDGLRTKGNLDQARAQARLADLQLVQQREQVAVEQASASAEFTRAEAAFEAQRQNVAEAEEAFRIANLRFERGLSTLLEVNDAQNALFTAQVNTARASVDYYLAAAELARARGANVPLPPVRPNSQ